MPVFTSIGLALGATAATAALTGAAIVAGGVGVAGSIASSKAAGKAVAAQQQAVAVQQQQAAVQATRQRRSSIRQNILACAGITNRATIAGVADSSGLAGGLGSAASQFGSNIGYSNQMSGLGNQLFSLQQTSLSAQGKSQLYSAVSGVGFGLAGSFMNPASAPSTVFSGLMPKQATT